MMMWSFHDGCADLKLGMGVATIRDLAYFVVVDFCCELPSLLNYGLSNAFSHPCLQLFEFANRLNHHLTYGIVGLMRVVGCFMQP